MALLNIGKAKEGEQMTTFTVKNNSFTTPRGNRVDVFNEKTVGSNGTFNGFDKTVRTFAVVCGVEVDVVPGCAFQAVRVVNEWGF